MTRIDYESGNIVGEGEDSAFAILKHLTGLAGRTLKEWGSEGIFRQVPVDWLISQEEFDILSPEQKKKSIDIIIAFRPDGTVIRASLPVLIIVRIQGKKGDLKLRRDGVQADIILKKYSVVDIHKREAKNLFKERTNELAIQEVISAFQTARVYLPVISKS